jgi:hypothetical protein
MSFPRVQSTVETTRRWIAFLAGAFLLSIVLMLLPFSPLLLISTIVMLFQGANPANYWLSKVQEDQSVLMLLWLGLFLPVAAVIVWHAQSRRELLKKLRD